MSRLGRGLIASVCAIALGGATAAGAGGAERPAKVEIEGVGLSAPRHGAAELLVAVRYPIELAGRPLEASVSLGRPGGTAHVWDLRETGSAGPRRQPDSRDSFRFVHRIRLTAAQTRQALRGATVGVAADAALDVDGDGRPEFASHDREAHRAARPAAGRRLCGSVPLQRARPGRPVAVLLPRCGAPVRWRVAGKPRGGPAYVHRGRLVYRPGRRFRGTATIPLRAAGSKEIAPHGGGDASSSARAAGPSASVEVVVLGERSEGAVVRAMGDSVTAGFGYYDDGTTMPFSQLLSCRPPESEYDDACSSNSAVRGNRKGSKIEYAPDYGLANDVSWAAQWANEYGVTNYANFAVSGSEPKDWAPGGVLYATTTRIEAESPDYVLMTIGANPLLSNVLFGVDNMGCAIWSQIVGGFSECVEKAFEGVELRANLATLYRELVQKTSATIYLMQYPLTVPSSALAYSSTQIAEMGALLNREIAAVAAEVNKQRLRPVAPPHFNVGIDISPVYPSEYTCSYLEYMVDGPSVQSEPTQDELLVDHPLSFCEGPAAGGPAWVISGDTGIHPSAAGYTQMVSRLPAP